MNTLKRLGRGTNTVESSISIFSESITAAVPMLSFVPVDYWELNLGSTSSRRIVQP